MECNRTLFKKEQSIDFYRECATYFAGNNFAPKHECIMNNLFRKRVFLVPRDTQTRYVEKYFCC